MSVGGIYPPYPVPVLDNMNIPFHYLKVVLSCGRQDNFLFTGTQKLYGVLGEVYQLATVPTCERIQLGTQPSDTGTHSLVTPGTRRRWEGSGAVHS